MALDINRFFDGTASSPIADQHAALRTSIELNYKPHGRTEEWDAALSRLAIEPANVIDFTQDTIKIGEPRSGINIKEDLKAFVPWRKGPFNIFGTFIDTEWRSDWKWQRITPHIADVDGKSVLDIGCGNGYHLFRMLGAGAKVAVGVDPTLIFQYQFQLIQQLIGDNNAYLLPLRSEHLPEFHCFDSVFSLGVLYHRRSPIDHLMELHSFLAPGGELILETLVIDDQNGEPMSLLLPEGRYAKMANVWFIPSVVLLERMLTRAGFTGVRTVDVNTTSMEEQRATEWMTFQSLKDYLDPLNPAKTIEGHPAPKRAIVIANRRT